MQPVVSGLRSVCAGVRCTTFCALFILSAITAVRMAAAEESAFHTLTDKTGKFKIEATIEGLKDGKVQLKTKDGREIVVPLEKLSPESSRQVVALTTQQQPKSVSPAGASKTIAYPLTAVTKAEIGLLTDKMKAEGIRILGGDNLSIQVSDSLTVSGVPVGFVQALAKRKLIYLEALGLVEKEAKPDRKVIAQALAASWILPTLALHGGAAEALGTEKPGALLSIIRADGTTAAALAADGVPVANPNLGRLFWEEIGSVPDYLTFASLLRRFDPAAPVTEENAAALAEELVWAKELNLSDGNFEHLADTRRLLQASIFEAMKFEIGDPLDANPEKQKLAREKLEKARQEFFETWEKGFAEKPTTKKS